MSSLDYECVSLLLSPLFAHYSFNFCCSPSSCMNSSLCLTLVLKEILALPMFHISGHSQSSQHEDRGSALFYTLCQGAEQRLERCDPSLKEVRLA